MLLGESLPETKFMKKLKAIAWLPEVQWEDQILAIHRRLAPESSIPEEEALAIFNSNKIYMRATRLRWGRSVQFTGPLNDLAPVIGVIRLGEIGAKEAALQFSQRVFKALTEKDADFLSRAEKLATVKIGAHRNFEVWNAIAELLSPRAFAPAPWLNSLLQQRLELQGINLAPLQWSFPDTNQVRKHVEKNPEAYPFLALLNDDKQWTRVWVNSGANLIIVKARKGSTN